MSRTAAVVIVFGIMLLILVVVVAVVLPLLQHQLLVFAANLPGYLDWFQLRALPWLQTQLGITELGVDINSIKQTLISHWQQLGGIGTQIIGAITRSWLAMLSLYAISPMP